MNLGTFTGSYAGGCDEPGCDGPMRVIILRQQKRATNPEAHWAAFP